MAVDEKIKELAEFLEIDEDRITRDEYYDGMGVYGKTSYLVDGNDRFFVADDEEAYRLAEDYIKDTLWAFNAEFIAAHTGKDLSDKAIKAIGKMQEALCEDANPLVEAMISDLDEFIEDAIEADGRGHFVNTYDGEEYMSGDYFIYSLDNDPEVYKSLETERE